MEKLFRILIVDDDIDWASYCAEGLKRIKNATIEVCTSVDDALRRIEEELFDLIFCDYRMEYEDTKGISHFNGGFRICAKAKAYLPQVKTVMVTAYGSADLARESLVTEKFDDYVEKGIDPKADRAKMEEYVREFIEKWDKGTIASNPFFAQRGQIPKHLVTRYLGDCSDFEFFTRQLQLAEQESHARFLILGRVGSGKSCLFIHYKNYAQKRGHLVSHYELPPDFNAKPLKEATSELLLGIIRGFPKVRFLELKNFAESVKNSGGKIEAFGFGVQLKWDRQDTTPEAILRSGLKSLIQDLKNKTDVIIILLDNISNAVPIPDALKHLFHIMSESSFMNQALALGLSLTTKKIEALSSTAQLDPMLSRFFAGNIFQLSNFTKGQVHEVISQTLAATGVTFDQSLIEKIHKYSDGHPFITQLLCKYLYDSQISGRVGSDAFGNVLQNCTLELCSFLDEFFSELNEEEKTILQVIALSENFLSPKDLLGLLLESNLANLIPRTNSICSSLVDRKILKLDENNRYQIDCS